MKKYTFICEYKKGTYISQYLSKDLYTALQTWAKNLTHPILSIKEKSILEEKVADLEWFPNAIEDVENVWCSTYIIRNSFLLLNIVETV